MIAWRVIYLEEIGSTNDYVKELAKNGADAGLCVIASRQTKGRGRLGRSWDGSEGDIFMSVLLKPTLLDASLTLFAGLCVARVLDRFLSNECAMIKWPNDILIDGKKICGILTESGDFGAIVGIGINVNRECFDGELKEKATSMRIVSGTAHDLDEIIKALLAELGERYEQFESFGMDFFMDEYRSRSTSCLGEIFNGEN